MLTEIIEDKENIFWENIVEKCINLSDLIYWDKSFSDSSIGDTRFEWNVT